ncbi:MAG TPA: hypothetical protein VN414_13595 [Methanosarcina sp.]|nr:hypothetical protein [Methanosarcina sp.]
MPASLFKKGLTENPEQRRDNNPFKKGLTENLLRKGFIENYVTA